MRRELIRMLVKRVEIGKEEINVVFRILPDPGELGSTEQSSQHCWGSDQPPVGKHLLACAGYVLGRTVFIARETCPICR